MIKERRKDFRRPGENLVVLRFTRGNESLEGEKILSAVAKNMSPGGAKIITEDQVPADMVLRVELSLPNTQKSVSMNGIVKWVRSVEGDKLFEVGLEFLNTPSESLLDLLEYTYKK